METILVVEDDPRITDHICELLRSAGFSPFHVADVAGLEACLADRQEFSAILLDRLFNGIDTKTRISFMRSKWPLTPILMVSAINTPLERAESLNLGVDDYLGKPFLSQELLARVRALTRRARRSESQYREVGDVILDIPRRILIRGSSQESLPAKEFLLLKLLSEEMGRVLSKNELLESIWAGALDVETNVVESTLTNLRRRLSQTGSTLVIRNARNLGYWLEG
jgi:two-component system, OmpR family, response regulator